MFPGSGGPKLDAVLPVWAKNAAGDNHFPPPPGYAPVDTAQMVLASCAVQPHIPYEDQKPYTL